MSFNLATILTETTLAAPDAPVCRIGGNTITYRELDGLSGRVAAGLREAGLSPGQVVALQLPNIPQFLTAYFGALKAGLVVLPRGREHVGEILIRGHNVMKGYLGQPEATAETLRDGWLHTGDLGYMDEDGFYFIVDRAKDLVIRGGYNVYPREIEEVLYAHPAVLEAAVIGKPDERLGEEVVAVVALREGASASAEEIIAYTRERLAAYKFPREIRFMAELPKGPSGKILKAALRDG
jgi:acyl-CoA synthetase (AMP-forming)/AMP-acid ligase II